MENKTIRRLHEEEENPHSSGSGGRNCKVKVVRSIARWSETDDGCGWNRFPANAPPVPLFIAATHPSRCNLLLHSGLAASPSMLG